MASRMDRYYKDELVTSGRSTKNKSLYQQIEDLDNYTNIEGVATIEKTNEIDISKVQAMLKNRENYKKQKQFREILREEKEELEKLPEIKEESKNYDIKDMLSRVKDETPSESSKHRSLNDDQYKLLKSLSVKEKKYDIEQEEKELKELINTITGTKALKSLSNTVYDDGDVGLLDDLKATTMIGDASSIKKIIEDEKEKEKELEDTNIDIDKSFYTSSFGFTQRDFEELKNMNHKIKKSNKFIIVLLFVLISVIVFGIAFFVLKNR